MTSMRASNGGDPVGVARGRKPIVNGRADPAALNRRIAGPMMARDEQNDPFATRNGSLQATIDRGPSSVEVHSVKIEHPIGLDVAASKLLVPAAVERLGSDGRRRRFGGGSGSHGGCLFRRPGSDGCCARLLSGERLLT